MIDLKTEHGLRYWSDFDSMSQSVHYCFCELYRQQIAMEGRTFFDGVDDHVNCLKAELGQLLSLGCLDEG